MADISDVAAELKTILAALADVDQSSLDTYVPLATTQKIALLIVPFQQSGLMEYATVMGGQTLVHAHNIPCEFWIKVSNANTAAAMERGRDICLQAMRLVAANPTLNGSVTTVGSSLLGNAGRIGPYNIAPRYEERGVVNFVIATLFVPVQLYD